MSEKLKVACCLLRLAKQLLVSPEGVYKVDMQVVQDYFNQFIPRGARDIQKLVDAGNGLVKVKKIRAGKAFIYPYGYESLESYLGLGALSLSPDIPMEALIPVEGDVV